MKVMLIYSRFERYWHWSHVAAVILLIITGFEIHGLFSFMGFETAVLVHDISAWSLIILVAASIIWHIYTGEWKQYIPTRENLGAMLKYYLVGIFKNEPHPVKKTAVLKLNPLQKLVYLGLKILVFPVQIATGILYYFHNELSLWGFPVTLESIAFIHTAFTYLIVLFTIIHVYLITTGHTVLSNLKAMITGYGEVDE